MRRPAFGVELHEYLDAQTVLKEAELAERLGYDSVWLGDSQLIWRELYVLLGAVAANTSRVALGTGVTNPVTRHASVTASAMATLQELSGGRAILGVGLGMTSLSTMGMRPATRADLGAYLETVRTLCEGGTAEGSHGPMKLNFGSRGKCPPIVIGAAGPKVLRLTGRIADGVILTGTARPGEMLRTMLQCVREGRAESAAPDKPFTTYLGVAAAVHADRSKALAVVRPHVAASALKNPRWELHGAARRASELVQRAYDRYEHMSPGDKFDTLIPDEVVSQFAIAGTPAECREQVVSLFEAGIDEITIRPYGVDGGSRAAALEDFAREVMARC
jgi:5,10-methylenetetrahydromethanopterin reductase